MEAVCDRFDEDAFVALLAKLVGEAEHLQNGLAVAPVEDRAGRHVLDALQPHSLEAGGPLDVRHISYVDGRGNIVVTYAGRSADCVSLVGMHLDVVPANPQTWSFDPFTLSRDGDVVRGRGVTDCLGHVALITLLLVELAKAKPTLSRTLKVVFIANEENSRILGVGVDELVKRGELDACKTGPLFWVDVAESRPCIGTGGIASWSLRATGKLGHSGMPQQSINSLELITEAVSELQKRFYARWPAHAQEAVYKFITPSTMKPTQLFNSGNSVNQIPGECTIAGDIRVTPFYDVAEVIASIDADVADINANLSQLPRRGPVSSFELPNEGLRGQLEITWGEGISRGVACDINSAGFKAMHAAFERVTGTCEPMAITGSLPCIRELQDAGFDVQTLGFGLMKHYHAVDEAASLKQFGVGWRVLADIMASQCGAN